MTKKRCMNCGAELLPPRTGRKRYDCGLPHVELCGVTVTRCSSCDYEEYEIPAVAELHRALARRIATRPGHLKPEEIRFLRKWLGWSGEDFAVAFGVTPVTVSRWEHGRSRMQEPTERFLRFLALDYPPVNDYAANGGDVVVAPIRRGVERINEAIDARKSAEKETVRLDYQSGWQAHHECADAK